MKFDSHIAHHNLGCDLFIASLHIDTDLPIVVSACRWPIEIIIQQAKQHLDMNDMKLTVG